MGNLWKHAKLCWGEETVATADNTKDIHVTREALEKKSVDSLITSAFEYVSKGNVTEQITSHDNITDLFTKLVSITQLKLGEYSLTLAFLDFIVCISVWKSFSG